MVSNCRFNSSQIPTIDILVDNDCVIQLTYFLALHLFSWRVVETISRQGNQKKIKVFK